MHEGEIKPETNTERIERELAQLNEILSIARRLQEEHADDADASIRDGYRILEEETLKQIDAMKAKFH